MKGVTFDAGGVDRSGSERPLGDRSVDACNRAWDTIHVIVPATALAQVIRNPARQARLSGLIRQSATDLAPLKGPEATAVGLS
jgi:hypothetical protein